MEKVNMMTYTDAFQEFLLDGKLKGNSRQTHLFYQRVLGYFQRDMKIETVDQITLAVCKRWLLSLMERDLSSVSVQSYVRGLRAFLHWLYINEYHSTDISEKFRLPKAQRKVIDILTPDEVRQLVSCFDVSDFHELRNLCICLLMVDSGLRLNETVTLQTARFHLPERYCIVDGKCNKQRYVPIGELTAQYFTQYIAVRPESPSLMCQADGKPITIETMKNMFRKLKKKSGIPRIHPHLLRHTFATRYLENGGNIYNLQIIMGHTTLEMVKKYLHLSSISMCKSFGKYSPVDNLMPSQLHSSETT